MHVCCMLKVNYILGIANGGSNADKDNAIGCIYVWWAGELHPGQHWSKFRCGLWRQPSHPLPPPWSLLLWTKQVTTASSHSL